MSFVCGICKRPQPDGTKPLQRITGYRQVVYDTETHVYKKSKRVNVKKTQGFGWEIAQEQNCCSFCNEQLGEPSCVSQRTIEQIQVEKV